MEGESDEYASEQESSDSDEEEAVNFDLLKISEVASPLHKICLGYV